MIIKCCCIIPNHNFIRFAPHRNCWLLSSNSDPPRRPKEFLSYCLNSFVKSPNLVVAWLQGLFLFMPFFWHRPICINLESTIANANNTVTAFSLFTIVGSSRGAVFSLISAISASYFLGNNCSFLSSFFSSRQIFN